MDVVMAGLLTIVYFSVTLFVSFKLGFNWLGMSLVLGGISALWGGSGGKSLWSARPMLRFKVLGLLWACALGYVGVLMVQNSQVILHIFDISITGDLWVIGGTILFFVRSSRNKASVLAKDEV